jgi:hypothetical protein
LRSASSGGCSADIGERGPTTSRSPESAASEVIDYTATARLNLRIDAAALRRAWDRAIGRRAEDFIRAGNDVACQICGRPYWQHPQDAERDWLVVRCDGQRLKL